MKRLLHSCTLALVAAAMSAPLLIDPPARLTLAWQPMPSNRRGTRAQRRAAAKKRAQKRVKKG